MGVEPVIMSAGELESERAGKLVPTRDSGGENQLIVDLSFFLFLGFCVGKYQF